MKIVKACICFALMGMMVGTAFVSVEASEHQNPEYYLEQSLSVTGFATAGLLGSASISFFTILSLNPNFLEVSANDAESLERFTSLGNTVLGVTAIGTAIGAAWGAYRISTEDSKTSNLLASFATSMAFGFGTYLFINEGNIQREPDIEDGSVKGLRFTPNEFFAMFAATLVGAILGHNIL